MGAKADIHRQATSISREHHCSRNYSPLRLAGRANKAMAPASTVVTRLERYWLSESLRVYRALRGRHHSFERAVRTGYVIPGQWQARKRHSRSR